MPQPLQKLVLSYVNFIATIARTSIMSISPEVISRIEEIGNGRTHGVSQLIRPLVEVVKIAAEHS